MIKYILSITHTCFVRNINISKNTYIIIGNKLLKMDLFNKILNIAFPRKCISCGKNDTDLCLDCLSVCPEAKNKSEDWIFPIYDYQYPQIKEAISLLKYKNKKGFAKVFAEILYGRIIEEISELKQFNNFTDPILIPIPLSKKRRTERGFNQSELISLELLKLDEKISSKMNRNFQLERNVLIKIKDSKHQVLSENRQERLKNIINSFSVIDSKKIKNENIILIDDVVTTGATLNEARKTLKKYGAKKVIAFTIAH